MAFAPPDNPILSIRIVPGLIWRVLVYPTSGGYELLVAWNTGSQKFELPREVGAHDILHQLCQLFQIKGMRPQSITFGSRDLYQLTLPALREGGMDSSLEEDPHHAALQFHYKSDPVLHEACQVCRRPLVFKSVENLIESGRRCKCGVLVCSVTCARMHSSRDPICDEVVRLQCELLPTTPAGLRKYGEVDVAGARPFVWAINREYHWQLLCAGVHGRGLFRRECDCYGCVTTLCG